jgi:hypothetical protein
VLHEKSPLLDEYKKQKKLYSTILRSAYNFDTYKREKLAELTNQRGAIEAQRQLLLDQNELITNQATKYEQEYQHLSNLISPPSTLGTIQFFMARRCPEFLTKHIPTLEANKMKIHEYECQIDKINKEVISYQVTASEPNNWNLSMINFMFKKLIADTTINRHSKYCPLASNKNRFTGIIENIHQCECLIKYYRKQQEIVNNYRSIEKEYQSYQRKLSDIFSLLYHNANYFRYLAFAKSHGLPLLEIPNDIRSIGKFFADIENYCVANKIGLPR